MPGQNTIKKLQFTVSFRPGTADEEVLKESFEHDLFFRRTPEYKVMPNHIIMDIGAHIGCFSMLAASKVPEGKVYSFEPAADTYAILQKNVQSNNCTNIRTFQAAIAAQSGNSLLYHDTTIGNWGHSITKAVSSETEEVNCVSLADFIKAEKLEHIDFIKFNCEGAEFGIIIQTPNEILQKINCMLILYHGYLEDRYSKTQMADHLSRAGFHIRYRYQNKDDDSGWMIAYRAGFFETIFIFLRTAPLSISLFLKEVRRKLMRVWQILFDKKQG